MKKTSVATVVQKQAGIGPRDAHRLAFASDTATAEDADVLTPIARTTLTVDICRKMVSLLIRGHWQEGEKIPAERELCLKLGVGRASLREALKAIEIMGLIETRLGDGTYVCRRSDFFSKPLLWMIAGGFDAQTRELVEARILIEVELAGLAAERASDSDLERLTEELERMKATRSSPAKFVQADVNFHLLVGAAACNGILMNALHLIRNLLQEWVLNAVNTEGVPDKAYAQHRQLLQAIKAHDPAAARRAMRKHLGDMANYLPKSPAQNKR